MKKGAFEKFLSFVLCLLCIAGMTGTAVAEPISDTTQDSAKGIEGCTVEDIQWEEGPVDEVSLLDIQEDTLPTEGIMDQPSALFNIQPLKDDIAINTARATMPDLTFGTVTMDHSQPFPSNTNIKYNVQIKNTGSASATNMTVSMYLDDTFQGMYMIEGTLGAGQSGIFYFNVNMFGGMHTIKLVLNENHAITESNYDNNVILSVGTWQSCIALSIDTFDAENGTYEVHSMTPKKFEFKVTNRGNVAVEEGYIMCKVDGSPVNLTTFNLGARRQLIGTIPFTFKKAGTYKLEVSVGPGTSQTDITPNDNVKTRSCDVTYDIELQAGHWSNPQNLDIQVYSGVFDYISQKDLKNAINQWNGIDSKVSFNTSQMLSVDEDKGKKVTFATYIDENTSVLGVTNVFKNDEKTWDQWVDSPEDEVCVCKKENIGFNLNGDFPNLNTEFKKATATHECGHLLGLKHTSCNDMAIMVDGIHSPLFATTIQEHDRYNLKMKY